MMLEYTCSLRLSGSTRVKLQVHFLLKFSLNEPVLLVLARLGLMTGTDFY